MTTLFLPVMLMSPARGATLNVCGACAYSDISSAVAASSPGDLISVDAGTYSDAVIVPHDLTIQSTLGKLYTVWAPSVGPAALVPLGVTLTIDGFRMGATVAGPVLEVDGGVLALDASEVSATTSTSCGAGLYLHDGATAAVSSSDLVDLHAVGAGGGGVCATTGSTLTTNSVDFDDNTGVDGGAVYLSDSSWTSSADDLRSNIVTGRGGGLFAVDSVVDLVSPALDRNEADEGGAVWLERSSLDASSNPTFTRGIAGTRAGAIASTDSSVVLDSPALQDNDSAGSAGAIAVVRGDLTTDNASFKRNAALGGDGGAIHATDATLLLTDGDVSSSDATDGAGVWMSGGSLTVVSVVFKGGGASGDGGGVYASDALVTLTGAEFDAHTAVGMGGGLYAIGSSTIYCKACDFSANLAAAGGGLAAIGVSSVSLDQVSMCGETATAGSGGAVYVDGVLGGVLLNRSSIVESSASADGGAVFSRDGSLIILNADLVGNDAGRGGAVFVEDTSLDMRNTAAAFTSSGSAVHGAGTSTAALDYNLWFTNTPGHLAGVFGPADHGAAAVFADPAYVLYDPLTCTNDFTPSGGSPLVDAGDPAIVDAADGSRSDIGSLGGGPAELGVDADGDGYPEGADCDDADPYVNPGAAEICGGGDEDCDGLVDDADPSLVGPSWFDDNDVDGFGDPGSETIACAQPPGTVADDTDCDDTDDTVNPAGTEVCGGGDEDCDGLVDDADPSLVGATSWFDDTDTDGYGDPAAESIACVQPPGTVVDATDCDDTNGSINPAATEVCGGGDEDCDGLVDDADPSVVGATSWFDDSDTDGFGDPAGEAIACTQPPGTVVDDTDCDDTRAAVNPAGTEVCGGGDEDCDGLVDDDDPSVSGTTSWFDDTDTDGFGDPAAETISCAQPPGTVVDATDCDDTNGTVNPAGTEVCGGGDEDCDGLVDDADPSLVGATSWFDDTDTDGYGDPAAESIACVQPPGTVVDATDCDDTNGSINPAATEVCGGGDEDCDGLVDDADPSVVGATTWFDDDDIDGYGDPAAQTIACAQPPGTVVDNTDCDDTNGAVNPAGTEVCGGGDEDCDTLVDDADPSVVGATSWFDDADTDGFGDPAAETIACAQPPGTVVDATDCDDTNGTVNPAGTEVCGGGDEDCDGLLDDADPSVTGASWFSDLDSDGFGDPTSEIKGCVQPAQTVADNTDCDDSLASVNPLGTEVCGGGDEDCDGLFDDADPTLSDGVTYWADTDADGYGDAAVEVVACVQPADTSDNPQDCDDSDPDISPAGTEVCGGGDEDCDGDVDDADASVTMTSTWYDDLDGDTYGGAAVVAEACVGPVGAVQTAGDCDDANDGVHPGAQEVCSGIDEDCNGLVDDEDPKVAGQPEWYPDADGDTYGATEVAVAACVAPSGYVADATDCDDTRADVNPAATERCDELDIDEDCDGAADDDDPQGAEGAVTAWLDADGDGFGGAEVDSCEADGTVEVGGDCADSDDSVFPGASEVCNGRDDDCDGLVDDEDPGVASLNVWFVDNDGDGFGGADQVGACDGGDGLVEAADDCDDADPLRYPGAVEIADDGIDQNCTGADMTIRYSGGGCGCVSTPATGAGLSWLWLGLVALARRRR